MGMQALPPKALRDITALSHTSLKPGERPVDRLLRELLSRRDPRGYYVIPARNTEEARSLAESEGADVEEAGDVLYIRVKSRSAAARIASRLARSGLLAL